MEVSKQEDKSTDNLFIYGLGMGLLFIYSVLIYFQAVTASMSESYLPGIETAKAILSPGLFLLIIVVAGMFAKKPAWRVVSNFVTGGAILICLLIFSLSGWNNDSNSSIPQEERHFVNVIYHSLTHPQFSNRSYFVAIYGGFIAAVLFVWSYLNSKMDRYLT